MDNYSFDSVIILFYKKIVFNKLNVVRNLYRLESKKYIGKVRVYFKKLTSNEFFVEELQFLFICDKIKTKICETVVYI